MEVTVDGVWYVALDHDTEEIRIPETGLQRMVRRNVAASRTDFTVNIEREIKRGNTASYRGSVRSAIVCDRRSKTHN